MQTLMVCTSCKTSYNVPNHFHDCHNFEACCVDLWCGVWGFVDMGGGGGGGKKCKRERLQVLDLQRLASLLYVLFFNDFKTQ